MTPNTEEKYQLPTLSFERKADEGALHPLSFSYYCRCPEVTLKNELHKQKIVNVLPPPRTNSGTQVLHDLPNKRVDLKCKPKQTQRQHIDLIHEKQLKMYFIRQIKKQHYISQHDFFLSGRFSVSIPKPMSNTMLNDFDCSEKVCNSEKVFFYTYIYM